METEMTRATNGRPESACYVPFVGKERNLHMLLYLTVTALHEARKAQLAEMGLTPADSDLLFLVDALGESATPASLSRWFQRKPPTVCVQLDRLEAKGLVDRRAIRGNKKSKRVVLTQKGRASLQEAMEEDIIASILSALSDKEHEQLWRLLEKLRGDALSRAKRLRDRESAGVA